MRYTGALVRFLIGLILFIAVLILGVVKPDLFSAFTGILPGNFSFKAGGAVVYAPVLAWVILSVFLTLVINLFSIPFRRSSKP